MPGPPPGPPSPQELARRFTYHPPIGDQVGRYERLRAAGGDLARLVVETTPASREQSLALTAIEEAIFWGNAAIARRSRSDE